MTLHRSRRCMSFNGEMRRCNNSRCCRRRLNISRASAMQTDNEPAILTFTTRNIGKWTANAYVQSTTTTTSIHHSFGGRICSSDLFFQMQRSRRMHWKKSWQSASINNYDATALESVQVSWLGWQQQQQSWCSSAFYNKHHNGHFPRTLVPVPYTNNWLKINVVLLHRLPLRRAAITLN